MSDKRLVLVVDDDPDLVEAVSMKLESENYRIAKAYDGIQAWEKIKEEKPALVILDVMMPKKDGYQMCEEIKSPIQRHYRGAPHSGRIGGDLYQLHP